MEHVFYIFSSPKSTPGGLSFPSFLTGILLTWFQKILIFNSTLINSCSKVANFKKFVLDLLNILKNPLIYSSTKCHFPPHPFKHEFMNGLFFSRSHYFFPSGKDSPNSPITPIPASPYRRVAVSPQTKTGGISLSSGFQSQINSPALLFGLYLGTTGGVSSTS